MAKRGQRFPFRVVYEYQPSQARPDGVKGRIPKGGQWDAEHEAKAIARRGGRAEVITVAEDGTETVVSTFEPRDPDDVEEEW